MWSCPEKPGCWCARNAPRQLAAAINYLLNEPAEAARMATAGRLLIADKFAPSSLATVLEAAYDSGRGPGGPGQPGAVAQPV